MVVHLPCRSLPIHGSKLHHSVRLHINPCRLHIESEQQCVRDPPDPARRLRDPPLRRAAGSRGIPGEGMGGTGAVAVVWTRGWWGLAGLRFWQRREGKSKRRRLRRERPIDGIGPD